MNNSLRQDEHQTKRKARQKAVRIRAIRISVEPHFSMLDMILQTVLKRAVFFSNFSSLNSGTVQHSAARASEKPKRSLYLYTG